MCQLKWQYAHHLANATDSRGPFQEHGLTLIPTRISNDTHIKVGDEITYPFPNVNGGTVEVWEWISNFILHFMMDAITYPCWD